MSKFLDSIKMHGFFDTIGIIVGDAGHKIFQLVAKSHERRNRRYDAVFEVDTAGYIPTSKQEFIGENIKSAIYYYPANEPSLHLVFRFLGNRKVDFTKFTFIDLGCGKGKPLLIASSYPLKSIVGVEASVSTSKIAGENISKYKNVKQKCSDITVQNADIFQYLLPEENLIILLSNPFDRDSPLYTELLNKIEAHGSLTGKKIFIIYYCPESIALFDYCKFLTKLAHFKTFFSSHDWVMYENKNPIY
ncbi:hypothetical protein BH09BAC3_BH09BAC3_33990 [soil metagenome]